MLRTPTASTIALTLTCCFLSGALSACGSGGSSPGTSSGSPDGALLIVGLNDNDPVTGTFSVFVDTAKVQEVRGVEFRVDGERVDTAILQPYTGRIRSIDFDDGEHEIEAVAASSTSDETFSDKVTLRFDNTGPQVSLVSPSNGEDLFVDGSTLSLGFEATDESGVEELSVRVEGVDVPVTGTPFVAVFTLADVALLAEQLPKTISVSVKATDAVGVESTTSFAVQVRPRLAWIFPTLGEVWDGPAVASNGRAFVGSRDGKLYAIDPTGMPAWSQPFDAGNEIVTGAAVWEAGGLVVFSSRSTVHALRMTTGEQVWAIPLNQTVATAPTVQGGYAYIGDYAPELVAIELSTGQVAWTFQGAGGTIQSQPLVNAFGSIIFGSDDGKVHAIDSSGTEQWSFQTGGEVWSSPAGTDDGDVLVGSHDGFLYRLNRYGTKLWEFDASGQIWGGPAIGEDGTVYTVSGSYQRLYAVTDAGAQRWSAKIDGAFRKVTPAIGADGTVYAGGSDGVLYAFDAGGKESWSYATGDAINGSAKLSPDATLVYTGSHDRSVYAFYTGAKGCAKPELVELASGNGAVMRYEASRVDADDTDEGADVTAVCGRASVRPWTNVTWAESRMACQKAGLDLCRGPTWEEACQGAAAADFPYGASYDGQACNGIDNAIGGCTTGECGPMPTGANASCASAAGVLDASGNVWEWTRDPGATPFTYLIRGGSYRDGGDDLRCSNVYPATHELPQNTRDPSIGFRCCSM